jgi:hypothetical protein
MMPLVKCQESAPSATDPFRDTLCPSSQTKFQTGLQLDTPRHLFLGF